MGDLSASMGSPGALPTVDEMATAAQGSAEDDVGEWRGRGRDKRSEFIRKLKGAGAVVADGDSIRDASTASPAFMPPRQVSQSPTPVEEYTYLDIGLGEYRHADLGTTSSTIGPTLEMF